MYIHYTYKTLKILLVSKLENPNFIFEIIVDYLKFILENGIENKLSNTLNKGYRVFPVT